jgi:hypothetical protein
MEDCGLDMGVWAGCAAGAGCEYVPWANAGEAARMSAPANAATAAPDAVIFERMRYLLLFADEGA